ESPDTDIEDNLESGSSQNTTKQLYNNNYILLICAAILCLFIGVISTIIVLVSESPIVPNFPAQYVTLVKGSKGAVAADNPTCSQVGVDILKKGGNAVDSIVATCLCIGVMNPWSSGIGGGGIMVISDTKGVVKTIDFRETAPLRAHRDMYLQDTKLAQRGGLAIAVPSEVKGLYTAHKQYGKLDWKVLVEPAINLATSHPAQELLVSHLELYRTEILTDKYGPGMRQIYAPNNDIVKEGEDVKNEALAATLRLIADQGADVMFGENGTLVDRIVKDVTSMGGIISREDLIKYQVKQSNPVSTYYRGYKVFGARPEISGGVCQSLMLNVLEQYNLAKNSRDAYQTYHYLIESMKMAFGHRMSLGDEKYLNLTNIVNDMTNKDYASFLRAFVPSNGVNSDLSRYLYNSTFLDPTQTSTSTLQFAKNDHGTSHMVSVDSDRMAVSLTSTVNLFFGSMVLSPDTGIIYNDQMDDFSSPNATNAYDLPPTTNNFIEPGKRPLSSMSPTIVHKDNKFHIALGGSGGPYILTAVAQTLINMIEYDMDVASAIQTPRLHHQLVPPVLQVENGFSTDVLKKIIDRDGYSKVDILEGAREDLGVVQGVRALSDGTLEAASDSRKKSVAAAY
ncbi:glutathione hydrolase, partial [Acrasis kona]